MVFPRASLPTYKSISAAVLAFAAAFCSAGLIHRDVVLEGETVEVEEAVSRARPESNCTKKSSALNLGVAAATVSNHLSWPALDRHYSFFSEHSLRSGFGGPLQI